MSNAIYPLRLSAADRKSFQQSARADGKPSVAEWLRELGRARAKSSAGRAACLDFTDAVEVPLEASRNPKQFIRKKMEARRALHR